MEYELQLVSFKELNFFWTLENFLIFVYHLNPRKNEREILIKKFLLAGSTLVVQNKKLVKSSLFTRKPKSVIIIGAGFFRIGCHMKLKKTVSM